MRLALQLCTSFGEHLHSQYALACLPNHALMKKENRLVELPAVCSCLYQPPVSVQAFLSRPRFITRDLVSAAVSDPPPGRPLVIVDFDINQSEHSNNPGQSSNID